VGDKEILAIVDQILASGCVEAAMEEARHFARQAQADLDHLPNNPYRQAMYGIADYAVARDI
jgi:geranylgeranyl pyrophosphate synthase